MPFAIEPYNTINSISSLFSAIARLTKSRKHSMLGRSDNCSNKIDHPFHILNGLFRSTWKYCSAGTPLTKASGYLEELEPLIARQR
jgi:hypothetical protein